MKKIIVHGTHCHDYARSDQAINIWVNDMDVLAARIFALMEKYNIPFYNVEPHNTDCPGLRFSWEDLEYNLFVLGH
ncbi:MAG: hypothetical protein FH749_04935 [Firmicutes bacterium]|nr:hypothetical protein [Bacillota bacterium]